MTEINKAKKSNAEYVKFGYAQVEPNHLSAQRTGQIYAQLPLADDMQVENGQFVKYNYAANKVEVNTNAGGEWMLVYNEVKTYDARETAADYVMNSASFGNPVPRVFKTNVGDIMTTNAIAGLAYKDNDVTIAAGTKLVVGSKGFLEVDEDATTGMIWQVAKDYTLADGQRAVKIVRIQ